MLNRYNLLARGNFIVVQKEFLLLKNNVLK